MSIAVLIDASWELSTVLPWAWRFACADGMPLRIFVPTQNHNSSTGRPLIELATEAVHQLGAPRAEGFRGATPDISCVALDDATEKVVRQALNEHAISMLIIPFHEGGAKGGLFSDEVLEHLFTHAPCGIMTLRPGHTLQDEAPRLLVPVSGGPHANYASRQAAKLADAWGGDLTLTTSIEAFAPEAQDMAERLLSRQLKPADYPNLLIRHQVLLGDDWKKQVAELVEEEPAESRCNALLLGASDRTTMKRSLFNVVPARLQQDLNLTIAVVRQPPRLHERTGERLRRCMEWLVPQLDRDQRIELVEKLYGSAELDFDFIALMGLSTAIAALGLALNSTAVVIGAMLVAPLMSPIVSAGLAVTQGNFLLVRRSARTVVLGCVIAWLFGALTGGLLHLIGYHTPTLEMLGRGQPNLLDLGVAFASGIAAAYALARPKLSGALAGVAIAAALVPPIATSGMAVSQGRPDVALGAALLFFTNVVAIILGSAFSLTTLGMRPRMLTSGRARLMRHAIMTLVITVVFLAIPLSINLAHTTPPLSETEARDRLACVLPKGAILWQVYINDQTVALQLSVPTPLTASQKQALADCLRLPEDWTLRICDAPLLQGS